MVRGQDSDVHSIRTARMAQDGVPVLTAAPVTPIEFADCADRIAAQDIGSPPDHHQATTNAASPPLVSSVVVCDQGSNTEQPHRDPNPALHTQPSQAFPQPRQRVAGRRCGRDSGRRVPLAGLCSFLRLRVGVRDSIACAARKATHLVFWLGFGRGRHAERHVQVCTDEYNWKQG